MSKLNILLPWKSVEENTADYDVMSRFAADAEWTYGWVQKISSGWTYCAYGHDDEIILYGLDAKTKEEVMKMVDDALIKAGWRLLNEGDPLLSLL